MCANWIDGSPPYPDHRPMLKSPILPITAAILALGIYIACLYWFASQMGAHVATHFAGDGHANGWMTNQAFLRFNLTLGVGSIVFVSGLIYLLRFLPPRFLNLPNREHWHKPENYPVACARLFRLSLWLCVMMLMWMALLNYQIVIANRLKPPTLDNNAMFLALATFAVMLGAWMITTWREFRLPDKGKSTKARR